MKQKYIIRETSVPASPPYAPLYFHGFTSRGAGACMVFGSNLAQEYDTLEAASRVLVKVKELSGRDTWDVEPKFLIPTKPTFLPKHQSNVCWRCDNYLRDHKGAGYSCP